MAKRRAMSPTTMTPARHRHPRNRDPPHEKARAAPLHAISLEQVEVGVLFTEHRVVVAEAEITPDAVRKIYEPQG